MSAINIKEEPLEFSQDVLECKIDEENEEDSNSRTEEVDRDEIKFKQEMDEVKDIDAVYVKEEGIDCEERDAGGEINTLKDEAENYIYDQESFDYDEIETPDKIYSVLKKTVDSLMSARSKQPYDDSLVIDCTLALELGTDPKPFKCSLCSYCSARKSHVVRHCLSHTGIRPFKCDLCTYSASDKGTFNRHVRTHTGERPFKCAECSYSASLKSTIVKHSRTHSGERPFKCDLCPYSASEKSKLTRHGRTHSGEKPFQCVQCPYSASDQSSLRKHLRTHTGERPYKCELCSYTAAQRSHLITHRNTHVREKRFECGQCNYRAVSNTLLKSHLRKHAKYKECGGST